MANNNKVTSNVSGSVAHDAPPNWHNLIKPKSHVITTSLDEDNYILWKYQIEIALKGYGLQNYIKGTLSIPPIMITDQGGNTIPNPDYTNFQKQDSLLSSWLLSSISPNLLSQIMGCNSSYEIWTTIEQIFSSQSAARVMQYRRELQNSRKEEMSMQEYLSKIKNLCDKLNAVGNKISDNE